MDITTSNRQPVALDLPLDQITFCVVDLETTGTSFSDAITEIGALKVQGGKAIGEFQTLVNPGLPISSFITTLTGITDQMVSTAPPLAEALPALLEFMGDHVLVAHNANFDVGFLKRGCHKLNHLWPGNHIVDTMTLARKVLPSGEVVNYKLATLATHFRATVDPNHRALSDVKSTVDVLHVLLERAKTFGVHTLGDLQKFR